jgi:endoglucanase
MVRSACLWIAVLVVGVMSLPLRLAAGEGIGWWDQQQRGANCFNHVMREQWFADASAAGIHLVRLAPSSWKGEGRDFLLGNADEFKGIPEADLQQLKQALDWADRYKVKVVIVPLSRPGLRWSQHNNDQVDDRLWKDFRYHEQSAAFWKELATELRGHPAVAGYNLINEPQVERALGVDGSEAKQKAFRQTKRGTPADLNLLYGRIIKAIREVDPATPIILDASNYGAIDGLGFLETSADPAILYAVHIYDPWFYSTWRKNEGKLKYGEQMTIYGETFRLDRKWIEARLQVVADWASRNKVPASRIFVGEIGCDRRCPGAEEYLRDVVAGVNVRQWHWAFYSYREDGWDGMDYELGTGRTPPRFWDLEGDAREAYMRTLRKPNPLWDVLSSQFHP